MQLKHVPLCFLVAASICLAGAVTASARSPAEGAETGTLENADLPLPRKVG
jgi:hypothetical protein